MTANTIRENFKYELKELLQKYKCEMSIEDFGVGYSEDNKIVVDFEYREELLNEAGSGLIPQLVLGSYFDKD